MPPKLTTKITCHPNASSVIRSDFLGCDAPDVAGVQQMLVSEGEGAEIVKRLDAYGPLVEAAYALVGVLDDIALRGEMLASHAQTRNAAFERVRRAMGLLDRCQEELP